MLFTVLGPVAVTAAGATHVLSRAQARAVLGFLLLHAGRVVSADRLVEALWGGAEPSSARNQVQSFVSAIRRQLRQLGMPDLLSSGASGYALHLAPDQLDLLMFEDALRRGQALSHEGRPADAAQALRAGLELWQGPPFGGAVGAFVEPARSRLEDRRLSAIEDLIGQELLLGNHDRVVAEFMRVRDAHPLRERLCGQLMLALYRADRRVDALGLYRDLRRALREDQGIDPGPALDKLGQAILRGDRDLGRPVVACRPIVTPRQLPADVAGFTGRDEQLANLDSLVASSAPGRSSAVTVVLITGTAGVGKTALAVHWAHRERDRFPDGQLYANLRGFDPGEPVSPLDVLTGFLQALGVPNDSVPVELEQAAGLYRSLLADRRMLVVLDDAASAEQVRPLLPGSPSCVVLVTSRDQLAGLVARNGALSVTLDPMTPREADDLLCRLLGTERTRAERSAIDRLAQLCARLPLALRIAAANLTRERHTSVAAYTERLRNGGRLAGLNIDNDEQTAVRATFDLSFIGLPAGTRRLFALLGLHPGPDISTAAVASLAGTSVDVARRELASLSQVHLIAEHVSGRYAMHDLLRAYASELAGNLDADAERRPALRRMLDHYLHTASSAALLLDPHRDPIALPAAMTGVTSEPLPDAGAATAWFIIERPVLLAAIELAIGNGFDTHACQLAWAMEHFLQRRAHWHDRAATQRAALQAARRLGDLRAQAYAHGALGRACARLGNYEDAHAHLGHAIDIAGRLDDKSVLAIMHMRLGRVCERQGELSAALDHHRHALDLFQSAGHQFGESAALSGIGWFHALLGNYEQAVSHCTRALALQQRIGDLRDEARIWHSLGFVHHKLGRHREAVTCYRRAIELFHQVDDHYEAARKLEELGDLQDAAEHRALAFESWQHALEIFDELRQPEADRLRPRFSTSGRSPGSRSRPQVSAGRRAAPWSRSPGRPR